MTEQATNQADSQQERVGQLQHLTRTDPDPRVRRRAQALLLVEEGETLTGVAQLFHASAHRVHVWQARLAVEGRNGLVDRTRRGRPPKLDAADLAFLTTAVEQGPQAYGLPVMVWSIRDVQALLARERGVTVRRHRQASPSGVTVSIYTAHRVVHALGYRYRRPRHDLTHRQDREAVAAAKRVLAWLQ